MVSISVLSKKTIRYLNQNKILTTIVIMASVLRLIGLGHGYPYIFNIDEPAVVRSAIGIHFNPLIDHFDWPHFNFYMNFGVHWIFIKLRGLLQILHLRKYIEGFLPLIWEDPFVFYFLSRGLSALFGILTIFPMYFIAQKVFTKKVALISCFIYTFMPYGIYSSHYAKQDPAMMFFITLSVMFYVYGLKAKRQVYFYNLAAISLGLATGVKYNAILYLGYFFPLLIFLAHNIGLSSRKILLKLIKIFLRIGIILTIVFLLTTPSIFFDWDIFWSYTYGRGVLWQLFENLIPLGFSAFFSILPKRIYLFIQNIGGFQISLIILACAVYKLKAFLKTKLMNYEDGFYLITFLFVLIMFLYQSRYGRAGSHYYLHLYPFIAIIAAVPLSLIVRKAEIASKYFPHLILFLFMSGMIIPSLRIADMFTKADSRSLVIRDAQHLLDENQDVYYEGEDFSSAVSINNLDIKSLRKKGSISAGTYLVTTDEKSLVDYSLLARYGQSDSMSGVSYLYIRK